MNTAERNMIKELVAIDDLMACLYLESDLRKDIVAKLIEKESYIERQLLHISTEEYAKYKNEVGKDWKRYDSQCQLIKKELNI